MRWPYTSPPPPAPTLEGARRVVRRFLILPACLSVDGEDRQEWRWLETAWVGEVYGWYTSGFDSSLQYGWSRKCFVADPSASFDL